MAKVDHKPSQNERIIDYMRKYGGITPLMVKNRIENMPDAVARGEWEVVHGVMTPGGDPLLRCPICKQKESYHMGGIEMPQNWNFCPNCGADMRKKVE